MAFHALAARQARGGGGKIPTYAVVVTAKDHYSTAGYTLFEGWEVSGKPWMTLLRGQVLLNQGELEQQPGYGRFLECDGPTAPIGGPVR